jgi:hypothetical protein
MSENPKRSLTVFLELLVVLLSVSGCLRSTPSNSPLSLSPLESPLESPVKAPDANEVRFKLDKPLIEGMSIVTGQGPKGVLLRVIDITAGGDVLGSGAINDDGKFRIELRVPLKAGHKVGIDLATPREAETWLMLWELRSEDAEAIPQMGYFFDTAVVTSRTQVP